MAILADFTPYMEPGGIDEAYLDLTGFEPLYGLCQGDGTTDETDDKEQNWSYRLDWHWQF